eukprot:208046-Alexandrium_andersonii.AAC.1
MSASLVGSEMCIRDSTKPGWQRDSASLIRRQRIPTPGARSGSQAGRWNCLLYTSDAADDM